MAKNLVKEHVTEVTPEQMNRAMGITNIEAQSEFKDAAGDLLKDLIEDGWDVEDAVEILLEIIRDVY